MAGPGRRHLWLTDLRQARSKLSVCGDRFLFPMVTGSVAPVIGCCSSVFVLSLIAVKNQEPTCGPRALSLRGHLPRLLAPFPHL